MTSEGTVRFRPDDISITPAPGDTILSLALRVSVPLLAPCGGAGRCGKCRVAVDGPSTGGDEPGILSPADLARAVRLACRCHPSLDAPIVVTIPPESRPARIISCVEGISGGDDRSPFVPPPEASGVSHPFAVAVDIGTTTLAAALIDLRDGTVVARAGCGNPQVACGDDLVSRIVFAEETEGGFTTLRRLLLDGIDAVVAELLRSMPSGGIVVRAAAAGNTVMSHIVAGIDPFPLRHPPYEPVVREYPLRTGAELGLFQASDAAWFLFPSIGGYVGGDIVAGLLASGFTERDGCALYFDVGTNGEVVLGGTDFAIACSSSAGPAFEGGEVSCGSRATNGAVDSVRIDPSTFAIETTTIGGGRPIGLCGSGIIDLCAELFRTGIVDRTGRFTKKPGVTLIETERGLGFVVVPAAQSGTDRDIVIAEADLRSILRTKAALCAAGESLLSAVGLPHDAVSTVFVAGGFGNFIDLRSALSLGAFPAYPLSKFETLGNASLAGAVMAAGSDVARAKAIEVGRVTTHHDLSTDAGFMEAYQKALFVPHTDEEAYRRILDQGD